MKRSDLAAAIGVVAVLAFGVFDVAAALAEPPEFVLKEGKSFPYYFDSTGGETSIETVNGHTVTCESVTNEGELENAHLLLVHILLHGCTTVISGTTLKCTTVGREEGLVLAFGLGHLGLIHYEGFTKLPGALISSGGAANLIETTCGTGVIKTKIEIKGDLVGRFTSEFNKQIEALQLTFEKGPTTGKPKYTEISFASGGEVEKALLLTKLGTGSEEESAESMVDKITMLPSGETIEIKT